MVEEILIGFLLAGSEAKCREAGKGETLSPARWGETQSSPITSPTSEQRVFPLRLLGVSPDRSIHPLAVSKRLARGDGLWHTRHVKRLIILIIAVVLIGAGFAVFLKFSTRNTPPQAVLPNPNGYDDFAAAAQWTVAWGGDLFALPPEGIRAAIKQNSKVLEEVHSGLKKQSAVPVTNDKTWFSTHMIQIAAHKSMAQLLVAEGIVHLEEGRTNEAARCFADCIVFAHAAHRHGLMIDELVGIACQAIGTKRLVEVAPSVSQDTLREILPDLIALDQAREPAVAIEQRDREWSRGAYGLLRSIWAGIVTQKSIRAVEASFEKKHARSIASLRLVMTDLAVRGYQAKTGKPPAALAELVPAWLPAVPIDPFSDRPLIYRVTTNSFSLYSVGSDGKDDQGKPIQRGGMEKGDLVPASL
jgi:hypothetical protein